MQEKEKGKKGLYETERVDNPCYVTLAVNPKEYFEFFQNYSSSKKHKRIKKGSRGMKFSNYANRIKSLLNFDTFEKSPAKYKQISRFTVKQGEMVKTNVTKTKFSQLNDKRFYFPDDILSLPCGHVALNEIVEFKRQKGQKIEKCFWQGKDKLYQMEKKALKNTPRLYLYHQILTKHPKIVNIERKNDFEPLDQPLVEKAQKILYSLENG